MFTVNGKEERKMKTDKIILGEYQKKRVCEFYGCSDLHGNQYPDCIWENDKMGIEPPEACHLHQVHQLINKLNKPCSHTKTICVNEEGNAGVFCVDCGEQLEKEC